jgi:hypothetical protein
MSERTYGGQTAAQWRGSVWCSEVMRAMLHHIDELQADLATASKGYAGRVRELEAQLAAAREDTARLDWAQRECRNEVRGTDYRLWSIRGREYSEDIRADIDAVRGAK